MISAVCALIVLRLFFWRIFPQYGTGFMSDILFGMYCLTALTLCALSRTRSPLFPWISLWITAAALSFFVTQNYTVTFSTWFTLLVYALIFCALQIALNKVDEAPAIPWSIIFFGAILSAALGVWEFIKLHFTPALPWLGMRRACSLQGWPTAFAGFLIMVIPSAWGLVRKNRRWYTWGILIILLLGLLSSMSALAIFSLGAAFILVAKNEDVKWGTIALGVMFLGVCDTKTLSSFLGARMEYYSAAWDMIAQHPFLGTGLGTFKSYGINKSAFAHNSYLQLWAECGPLGMIALVGLALALWSMKPNKDDTFQQALFTGLLAVFIDNLFSFTILASSLSFVWWIGLAIYCHVWQKGRVNGLNIGH